MRFAAGLTILVPKEGWKICRECSKATVMMFVSLLAQRKHSTDELGKCSPVFRVYRQECHFRRSGLQWDSFSNFWPLSGAALLNL